MGKSVAKLRRQARRAESRGGEDAAAAAAALAQRQAEAEAAAVAEAARIKAQKKRRHEANKEKLKQRKKAKAAERASVQAPPLTLLLGNLKRDLDVEDAVGAFLEKHGVEVVKVKAVGSSGARAKVTVASESDVAKGVALHRRMLSGRPVNIERGGPDSGSEETAAAAQAAQREMATALLREAGLERLSEDEQLVRHLAYHNEVTGRKALVYYCRAAQAGARNEAAVISALLKKEAAMEEEEGEVAKGEGHGAAGEEGEQGHEGQEEAEDEEEDEG